jgi:hypothetical protein
MAFYSRCDDYLGITKLWEVRALLQMMIDAVLHEIADENTFAHSPVTPQFGR